MKIKNLIQTGVLALMGAAMAAPSARAATITTNLDELILGFRASGGTGQNDNLEVDLGSVSQFHNAAPGSSFAITGLSLTDLSAIYGASWSSRDDLFWGVVGTTGRAAGGPDAEPVKTLWATRAEAVAGVQSTPWSRGSTFAQANASANIEPMFVNGAPGTLNGATSTANSNFAADINATLAGSWSAQDLKTAGTSFGYFNPTIVNDTNLAGSGGVKVADLYELQPGSGPGTFLGTFTLTDNGLVFQAIPEPSTVWSMALGMGLMMVAVRKRRAAAKLA